MITTNSIKDILLKDVKANPILGKLPEIVKDKHKPVTKKNVDERIVVLVNASSNDQLQRAYARICIYVPDIEITPTEGAKYNEPDNARLNELEEVAMEMFRSSVYGEFGKERYIYKLEDIVQEADPETWSSFLNVRVKFEVVNTKL